MRANGYLPATRLGAAILIGSLVLSSCGGTSPVASEPAASGSAATASGAVGRSAAPSSPPSAPIASPSITFAFDPVDPVITRPLTGIDGLYVNPGAVIERGGELHMFANVFSTWPGHVDVPHLVSNDGVAWRLATAAPALSSEDVPFTGAGADVSTGFVTPDGTWVLIFETVENGSPWKLGRATAPGPDGPWEVDPEPILEAGPSGSWDAGGLSWPSVIATTTGYSMYDTGLDRPLGTGAIGLATSTDGSSWTKHDGPVFGAEASWELGKLDRPRVVATPRGLAMVYAGGHLTDRGLAWSDDGLSWRRDGGAPVINQDRFPIDGKAWDAALLYRNGALAYYLEIGSASGAAGTNDYLATALLP